MHTNREHISFYYYLIWQGKNYTLICIPKRSETNLQPIHTSTSKAPNLSIGGHFIHCQEATSHLILTLRKTDGRMFDLHGSLQWALYYLVYFIAWAVLYYYLKGGSSLIPFLSFVFIS